MASVEERIRQLVDENLEVDGRPLGRPLDLNTNLIEAGVSSMDAVAFMQVVSKEFDTSRFLRKSVRKFVPWGCWSSTSIRTPVEHSWTRKQSAPGVTIADVPVRSTGSFVAGRIPPPIRNRANT